MNITAFIM